jgi:drug/metabolite transporter (DMT)-like permease
LLGEKVRGAQWFAVGFAAAGLVAILSPWSETLDLKASLYSLAAAFCWGAGNIVAKCMALDDDELINISAWQMTIGGVGLTALAVLVDVEPVRWTASFSLALGYNIVLATAIAWLLWLYALNRLSAGAAGLASLGAPVFSLATAWIQLGEVPTRSEAIGMGLILAALAWLSALGWRRLSRSAASL